METQWGMLGSEASSLAEKKGECHQMQICQKKKKTKTKTKHPFWSSVTLGGSWGQARELSRLWRSRVHLTRVVG